MAERTPDEAEIPLDELAATPFPKLVISGGHNAAFDAVCDVLEARLPAKRVVLPGAGHSLPRAPGYNDALVGVPRARVVIETERLIIRAPRAHERAADVRALRRSRRTSAATRTPTRRRFAAGRTACRGASGNGRPGELVGDCSLHYDTTSARGSSSYGFRRDRWGRGYASEAAEAVVRYGFETMRVARIVADVDPANPASSRVLEKCGFVRVGELEDGRLFYAVTR